MPYRKTNIWASLDWLTIAIYLILVTAGWLSIHASGYNYDRISMFDISGRAGMQMIWIISSMIIGISLLMIDSDWYEIFAYWIYAFIIILLIITVFVAPDIKGTRSWLIMGPVRIQPAELAKLATALALARLMGTYKFELNNTSGYMKALALILLPLLLIIMQKETGSALVFLTFFIVLYREGMSGYIIFAGFCAVAFFILGVRYDEVLWNATPVGQYSVLTLIIIMSNGLLWINRGKNKFNFFYIITLGTLALSFLVSLFYQFDQIYVCLGIVGFIIISLLALFLKYRAYKYILIAVFAIASVAYLFSVDYVFSDVLQPHQQDRIKVSLGMIEDPNGVGYNVNQSKIAIGSGGFWGKGYLNGTQTKLKYVPEQDTDFIFCTIGEEEGFLGTSITMILFTVLIIRIILMAERQRAVFHRVYGYSLASILFFHLAINIGMVIGITPVIGIPLPFFSYGGSSLWSFTALLFIFLRLDASRNDRL
ncbi:MAG: rod shape-determining protein RodA [Dysgonamonadaceae bacterium]|jgi:rod shape determining protein RodA|nr:rod shape-determining protein RodA [Dysgonamonadaceae bacterium]